ncbi:hypothetical protein SAMN05660297_01890 [Natronincola peptidivorans]|uniref:Uncharacterized protein n=1 Tax=Natronincola peptidivorans TaxID=426128 RepID=A0A1I0D6V0_9FIRM|nr:hypothetical protein [Natronincola peptidivorans]SET27906.1 hypothetical protein SAMN05660297_01890 [Natronincola peptidivorans]
MLNRIIAILLMAFTITVFNIQEINTYKSHDSKTLTIEDTIDSFKSQTTFRKIC